MSTLMIAPKPNVLVGITHTPAGAPVIRESKVLKVGIAPSRGKACDVFVNPDGKWVIRTGTKTDGKLQWTTETFETRKDAETGFRAAWKRAAVCDYPRKFTYFTFTRPVTDADGERVYVPDWEATEVSSFADMTKPGAPTEIDIMFFDNEPYRAAYENWGAAELRCHGDGINALRVLAMAKGPEEQALAADAKAAGAKYFPIMDGCWTKGCPYAKETTGANGKPVAAPCKPSATLTFQLVRNIRVGNTAFFHTGSYKSITQIFSAIERIKSLTGGVIAGIPLKFVIRSHKTNHNNQPAVQQNVSIEFHAEDMDHLREKLLEQAWNFKNVGQLAAPVEDFAPADEIDPGEDFIDDEAASPAAAAPSAAIATAAATSALAEKLKSAGRSTAPAEQPKTSLVGAAPWSDAAGMRADFRKQRDRIGEGACNAVFAAHSMTFAHLQPDDPKAMAAYADMAALPDRKAATVAADDPF